MLDPESASVVTVVEFEEILHELYVIPAEYQIREQVYTVALVAQSRVSCAHTRSTWECTVAVDYQDVVAKARGFLVCRLRSLSGKPKKRL